MNKAEFIAKYGEEAYQRKLEKSKQYYQVNRKKILKSRKEYCEANRETITERGKRYYQANKEKIAEYIKQWRKDNPEYSKQHYLANREHYIECSRQYKQKNKERLVEYYETNKARFNEQKREYYNTIYGRAVGLLKGYRHQDKKLNRGECTLTPQWIIENIFSNSCLYCGEKDWHKLGCDRIDNSKPHTPDNVVCCCRKCNCSRQDAGFEKFLWLSWNKKFKN